MNDRNLKADNRKGKTKLTPQQVEDIGNEYLKNCWTNRVVPTIGMMCIEMGITRTTLDEWEKQSRFSNTIKDLKSQVKEMTENALVNGLGSTTGIIFSLKNNYGWKEKQEVVADVNQTINIDVNWDD